MRIRPWPVLVLAAFIPLSALATPVTYNFSGFVDGSGFYEEPLPPNFTLLPYGTPFSGSFTYDDAAPAYFQDANVANYRDLVTDGYLSLGLNGSLGTSVFADLPQSAATPYSSYLLLINDVEYLGNPPYDQFNLVITLAPLPGDPANSVRRLGFSASSDSATLFPAGYALADPLPGESIVAAGNRALVQWSYTEYDASGGVIVSASTGGPLQALSQVRPVPEPPTLWLMAAALALAALSPSVRRRRAARVRG